MVFKTLADTNLRFLVGDFPKEGGKMQVGKGAFFRGFMMRDLEHKIVESPNSPGFCEF